MISAKALRFLVMALSCAGVLLLLSCAQCMRDLQTLVAGSLQAEQGVGVAMLRRSINQKLTQMSMTCTPQQKALLLMAASTAHGDDANMQSHRDFTLIELLAALALLVILAAIRPLQPSLPAHDLGWGLERDAQEGIQAVFSTQHRQHGIVHEV